MTVANEIASPAITALVHARVEIRARITLNAQRLADLTAAFKVTTALDRRRAMVLEITACQVEHDRLASVSRAISEGIDALEILAG